MVELQTKNDLQLFLSKVSKMRTKQKEFFRSRNDVTKKQAIELESQVDAAMIQLVRKGYKPTEANQTPTQENLF